MMQEPGQLEGCPLVPSKRFHRIRWVKSSPLNGSSRFPPSGSSSSSEDDDDGISAAAFLKKKEGAVESRSKFLKKIEVRVPGKSLKERFYDSPPRGCPEGFRVGEPKPPWGNVRQNLPFFSARLSTSIRFY